MAANNHSMTGSEHGHSFTRNETRNSRANTRSSQCIADRADIADPTEPPRRRQSVFSRMGMAPLDITPATSQRAFKVEDMPARSPAGAPRNHSLIMRKKLHATPAGDELETNDDDDRPLASESEHLLNERRSQAARRSSVRMSKKDDVPVDVEYPWHSSAIDDLYNRLDTRAGGLTSAEAAAALVKHGKNAITPPDPPTFIGRYLRNLLSPFSLMLLAGGSLAYVIVIIAGVKQHQLDKQTLALACVLYAVAMLTSLFQTIMETASDNLMDALRAMTADTAWVLRDGELKEVNAETIVPGDIVHVKMGEKVPADLRVTESIDLKVNNAALTGENLDVKLGLEPLNDICFNARNIAWSGCGFTNGRGVGVVFATGDNTTFGKVAKAAVDAEKPDTLMRREVRRLILIMSIAGTLMALAFAGAAMGTGRGWQTAVIVLVGLFTANIPEGLLPQITIALTITARRMFARNVVVSNLEIIETLGAVSTICSDKTGTLTMNKMTVAHVVYEGKIHMTPSAPVLPDDTVLPVERGANRACDATITNAALNSDAVFVEREGTDIAKWLVRGDASEAALIRYVQEKEDIDELRNKYERLCVIPFNSKAKYMASVHRIRGTQGTQTVMMKGAAERILERCAHVLTGAGEIPLTVELKEELNACILNLAKRGERVLAFAQLDVHMADNFKFEADGDDVNFPLNNLTFAGMMALVDPPRPSVKGAIEACHRAGIHVIMVTGDHPVTALAISRALGLISLPTLEEAGPHADVSQCSAVVTGDDILRYTQADWDRALSCKEHVFARTQPEQKQQLVWRLNERGHIVAMTGDGVNDAPALKAANVGVAVGSGTTVAKEAAQIIITDDDFGSIVIGVREGRQIFDNLKKAVTYIVTHLCPETIPYLFNFAVGIPLAMETIVIILIDLGTDMLPGISLAYEEAEDRVMEIPPRTADDHLIAPRMIVMGYVWTGLLESFFSLWAFYWTFYSYGFDVHSTIGANDGYRDSFANLNDHYKKIYFDMCTGNAQYNREHSCLDMEGFMKHIDTVVSEAQAAYFITLVAMQFANLLNRRHQTLSVFARNQQLNWRMFVSIVASTIFMLVIVYAPGLNNAFFLAGVSSANAASGLWGIPVMIGLEEIRKFFVRRNPDGFVARYTVY